MALSTCGSLSHPSEQMDPDTRASDSGASDGGASDSATPDALISRLSFQPVFQFHSMIYSPNEVIEPTILQRIPSSSSLGHLDTVPTELQRIILGLVDFQSLSRFARVCHQAKALVESLLSYQDMTKHASPTLMAMSRMKVLTFHTAATMHAALLSDKCVSCHSYGPFIFLPTCERCCYKCLQEETSLQVVTLRMGEHYFGLKKWDLVAQNMNGRMPLMIRLPQQCSQHGVITDDSEIRLYGYEQAKELGISVHGSEAAARVEGYAASELDAQLNYLNRYGRVEFTDKLYDCIASIRFSTLRPNGEVERGLWCLGCQKPDTFVSDGLEQQARSKSEFLEHIKDCKGAQKLLRKKGKGVSGQQNNTNAG